jgi:hypothetical protein
MSRTSVSIRLAGRVPDPPAARASATSDRRRWLILGTVSLAQLMVVLDGNVTSQHERR